MYQIGILSKAGASLTRVRSYISKSPLLDPKAFVNSNDFMLSLKQNNFKAFVLNNDEFKESHIKIIYQIKKYFPDLPIIIVAEKTYPGLKSQLAKQNKCILLNYQTELQDINGILMKMINNHTVSPRLCNRYKTAQPAKLKLGDQPAYSAWILNLAQDGACFRVFHHKFKKGDMIRVEVPLPQLKKTHVIQGKIVWEKADKINTEYTSFSQRIGIHFEAS